MGDMSLVILLDFTAQQQREDASRHLVNDLSHELRTPLATILTHLEVLGLSELSPEVQRRSIQLLKAEANRMARLVNQLLEIGRLETSLDIERRPLDLLALVEHVVSQLTPQASARGIALNLEADAPLARLVGDADRLQQVFLNLIDNSIKYSRPGDRVEVSLSQQPDGIYCSVRDNGPGIPAEHLPHITERFYRAASRDLAGSGLGLALVDEILRRHDSKLQIESQADGEVTGTCMSFILLVNANSARVVQARPVSGRHERG
jgi:two-component system phosphate regulon sensor histidine kinase PhoR